jgi:hypothetical protein
MKLRAGAAVFALAISSPAFAQANAAPVSAEAQTAPQAEAAAAPVTEPVVRVVPANILPKDTEIHFRTLTALGSKKSKIGDRFDLEVADDIKVGDRIVIARGSHAVGRVTFVKKKGGWGKSGKLEAEVTSVTVNGVDVSVHGRVGDKGKVGTGAVVGAVLFSPIIVAPFVGFFVTGTSALVPAGSDAYGTLDSDLAFDPATAPIATMAAAAPAPASDGAAPAAAPAAPAAPQ